MRTAPLPRAVTPRTQKQKTSHQDRAIEACPGAQPADRIRPPGCPPPAPSLGSAEELGLSGPRPGPTIPPPAPGQAASGHPQPCQRPRAQLRPSSVPRPGRGLPRARPRPSPSPRPAPGVSRFPGLPRAYPRPHGGRSRPYLHGVGADDLPAEAQPQLQRQRRLAGAGSAEDHHQRPRPRRGPAQAKRGRRHGPARPGGCHGDERAGRGRDGAGASRGEDGAGPCAPYPSARRGSCPPERVPPLVPVPGPPVPCPPPTPTPPAPDRVLIPVPCPSPRPQPLLGSPGHPSPSGPRTPGPCQRVGFCTVVPFSGQRGVGWGGKDAVAIATGQESEERGCFHSNREERVAVATRGLRGRLVLPHRHGNTGR